MAILDPQPRTDVPLVAEAPPPAPVPKSPRRIGWLRRKRALVAFWRTFRRSKMGIAGLVLMVLFILMATFGPMFVSKTELSVAFAPGKPFQSPNWQYPLGTDNFGRSVLDLMIVGARISLIVGFAATFVTMLLGAGIGVASGFYGGRIDTLLNAFTNWFLVIPWIALAIVMASILGPTLLNIILIIGITSWAGTARLVRAQALTVKERPYVERARALGAGDWHTVSRHILPNVMPVVFANTVLTVALSILAETTLSLLGLGDPNSISWGTTIHASFEEGALTAGYWWWVIPPGVMIVLVVLAFTMCGYALDEVLNPRLRQR
jgi:peptide/nickel transport system permease protein